ncbi:hypothetical protein COV23_01005 [Candidatus Wolfebacteria bacterium CG10_big_fil_rev_8_21_14_0_10_31_9]|uniref:RNHCP domain-containing protein n=1 Tax=Candidatus Wolfebacteria bacterium CG10_big_fil_rev_8_21_14_0_10_31_9 TaxID=1975070 RepID=A0A2H0RDY7_9BACT|nr:MAG: hypothetical protein COV23_01005 [Candidatus Wolfebacteria bacterium CG10_big_fil_rev_8_21_14_0_10_31_9]
MFKKNKEDFDCLNCNHKVIGSGYTNHCPKCLHSLHIDIYPGDRSAYCKGMMVPLHIFYEGGMFYIMHKCVKCGIEKKNKTSDKDDLENYFKTLEAEK